MHNNANGCSYWCCMASPLESMEVRFLTLKHYFCTRIGKGYLNDLHRITHFPPEYEKGKSVVRFDFAQEELRR